MEKSVKVTLIIAVTAILIVLIGVFAYFQAKPSTTISVNGDAVIKVMPDLVTVYFNVDTNGASAREAEDKNAEIVDNILTELIKLGFERKEIQTQNFAVYPDYSWEDGTQKLIGYKATHSMKVQISAEDIEKAGDVIDAVVDADALVNFINFELKQETQNQYKAEALKQATEDARIKAESIAQGLGKSLGSIVSISDSSFDYYPWPIYASGGIKDVAAVREASTSIQPGEQQVAARVSIVYRLR